MAMFFLLQRVQMEKEKCSRVLQACFAKNRKYICVLQPMWFLPVNSFS